MKSFIIIFLLVLSNFVSAQLYINEYSAANFDSYQDNYGEYEDWIEIYNASAVAIDLNGYYLTDKVSNPTKYIKQVEHQTFPYAPSGFSIGKC